MGLKSRRIVQVAASIGFVLVGITGFGQVTAADFDCALNLQEKYNSLVQRCRPLVQRSSAAGTSPPLSR
jgi:hypothetical protein